MLISIFPQGITDPFRLSVSSFFLSTREQTGSIIPWAGIFCISLKILAATIATLDMWKSIYAHPPMPRCNLSSLAVFLFSFTFCRVRYSSSTFLVTIFHIRLAPTVHPMRQGSSERASKIKGDREGRWRSYRKDEAANRRDFPHT